MLIRIDARRLKVPGGLQAAFVQALGLAADVGKNRDALVDVLTHLDHPQSTLARVKVSPGELIVIMIEHRDAKDRKITTVLRSLVDMIAFVNWRRLERGESPILAPAYDVVT